MTVMEDAQILWDYHQLHHEPRNTDVAIGLGSHDIGVVEHAAELWHEGRFPLIVFTGANAPTTVNVFPCGEAVHYAERAQDLGVPSEAIVAEIQATNTSENLALTHELLDSIGVHAIRQTCLSGTRSGSESTQSDASRSPKRCRRKCALPTVDSSREGMRRG